MNISKIIEQFGYKPNEVKVYLTTLAIVESTASKIASKAKLPLSSTQSALEKLHKDGLVNFYVRKNHKYWVAEPPEKLIQIFKTKEEKLSSALKGIKSSESKQKNKPEIKVFFGADEIKLIHDSMIQKKHPILAVIPWEAWSDLLGKDYLNDFISSRKEHFLSMRMLVQRTPTAIKIKEKDSAELRQTKFMPNNIPVENAFFIYGNNVAIVTLNEEMPTAVVIRDVTTARMVSAFFEDLWGRASN